MALFATPELCLALLICAHIKILRFLFRLMQMLYPPPPSPCVVGCSGTLLCKDAPHHLPEMRWAQFIIDSVGACNGTIVMDSVSG